MLKNIFSYSNFYITLNCFYIFFLFSIECISQDFEGTITLKIKVNPETKHSSIYYDTTWMYSIKNDMIRDEYSGNFFDYYHIYSNTKSGKIALCIIDTIQKYFEVLLDEANGIYNLDEFQKRYKRYKSKDKKILGYNCKCYYIINKGYPLPYRSDIWITDSIIPKINASIFIKGRGVILKSHFKSKISELIKEVVAIEPKPISDELFKIPADCKPRKSKIPEEMRHYKVDEKLIPRDSLSHVKDTAEINFGKWSEDN